MPRRRGQALVEFALILPLLLTLIGGSVKVWYTQTRATELANAAHDGAELGATMAGDPNRCRDALAAALSVYRWPVQDATCSSTPGLVEVRLAAIVSFPVAFLPDPWSVSTVQRAAIR